MKIEVVKLSQIAESPNNPRTITPEALGGLQDSILAFPKMLEVRPIVVDEINTALGGNMRIRALNGIAGMSIEEIKERLDRKKGFTAKPESEQAEIIRHWSVWLKKKTAYIVRASELTESEKSQFMVKDNVSYGEWDAEGLREVGQDLLQDWGLEIDFSSADESKPTEVGKTPAAQPKSESDIPEEALPEELRGVDMQPDDIPKYEGTEETKFDYIAISYRECEREEVAEALKVAPEWLFAKVCWDIDSYLHIRGQ